MAGKGGVDHALVEILEKLYAIDEDTKRRKKIRTLSAAEVQRVKKLLRKQRDDYLFPKEHFYIRTDRRTGKKYLVRSRRIS